MLKNAHFKPKTGLERKKQICRKSFIYTTNSNFSYRCKAVSDNYVTCIINTDNLICIWGEKKLSVQTDIIGYYLSCYRHILSRKIFHRYDNRLYIYILKILKYFNNCAIQLKSKKVSIYKGLKPVLLKQTTTK